MTTYRGQSIEVIEVEGKWDYRLFMANGYMAAGYGLLTREEAEREARRAIDGILGKR